MVKGFGEASVSINKSNKSSSLRPAIDCEQIQQQLAEHFKDLEDPRGSSSCASSIYQYYGDPLCGCLRHRLPRDNWRSARMGRY